MNQKPYTVTKAGDPDCIHNWVLGSAQEGIIHATCKLCSEERDLPAELSPAARKEVTPLYQGRVRAAPEREPIPASSKGNKWERHKYLEGHREEITADIEGIGEALTSHKWGISAGTLSGLKSRWHLPMKSKHAPHRHPRASPKPQQRPHDGRDYLSYRESLVAHVIRKGQALAELRAALDNLQRVEKDGAAELEELETALRVSDRVMGLKATKGEEE